MCDNAGELSRGGPGRRRRDYCRLLYRDGRRRRSLRFLIRSRIQLKYKRHQKTKQQTITII